MESLHNLYLTSSNWKHNVEDYLQTKHIIEEKVDTRLFDWIMKYAVNLRMPPIFALGPKLSIEKAVQLFANFDHLEICNLVWHDALFLLRIAFSDWVPSDHVLSFLVQSLRKRPTSCRIDADIFRNCDYGHMSNLLECKCCTLRIYGKKESTNLSKVLNAFAYIDRLILSDGSLERVSSRLQIELQIEHATLINVSIDRCEGRALLRLFAAVKHTFQMDKFPVCAESCRLFKRFLRVQQSQSL